MSNRWSIRETLDEDWKTSIAVEGVLVISDQRYKADSMRLMTSVHLIPYAKLTHREFYKSEDGLTLQYRYQMTERGPAPPPLVIDWDGTYTEKSDQSAITISIYKAKVKGTATPPNGWGLARYKAYMYNVLLRMVMSRITLDPNNPNRLPGNNPHSHIIKDYTVIEVLGKPELSIDVVVQNTSDPLFIDFQHRLLRMGQNFEFANYDPRWWPIPPAFPWDVASMNSEKLNIGSHFDMFPQTPQDQWHGKPRGWAVQFNSAVRGDSLDSVYLYPGVSGPPALSNLVARFLPSAHNWSNEQMTAGASYISVESQNKYSGDRGKMALPLSKARTDPYGILGVVTAVAIGVHAGMNLRIFTFNCTRQNDWPKIPAPKDLLTIPPRPGSTQGASSETLLKADVIPFKPDLEADGKTFNYTVQCRFVYMASRAADAFRVPRDPMVKPIAVTGISDQELPIAYLYDFSNSIENTGPSDA